VKNKEILLLQRPEGRSGLSKLLREADNKPQRDIVTMCGCNSDQGAERAHRFSVDPQYFFQQDRCNEGKKVKTDNSRPDPTVVHAKIYIK